MSRIIGCIFVFVVMFGCVSEAPEASPILPTQLFVVSTIDWQWRDPAPAVGEDVQLNPDELLWVQIYEKNGLLPSEFRASINGTQLVFQISEKQWPSLHSNGVNLSLARGWDGEYYYVDIAIQPENNSVIVKKMEFFNFSKIQYEYF